MQKLFNLLVICVFFLKIIFPCETAKLLQQESGEDLSNDERVDMSAEMERFEQHKEMHMHESFEKGQEEQSTAATVGIRTFDLESLCFGNDESVPLGPCSSMFLKCGQFNSNPRFRFEECPLGSVFAGKECKPARKVRDCFLPEINLLNDATEKLAKALDFCARQEPFRPVVYYFDGPSQKDKCSRQALLCRGTAGIPLAISCPSGKMFNPKGLQCVDALVQCAFTAVSMQMPIRQHLLQMICAQQQQDDDAGTQQAFVAPMFPSSMQKQQQQMLISANNGKNRCRNWYFLCPSIEANKEPELVFCDNGKMFDPLKRVCRRILPEDRCPHLGACRGWEWRMSPLGECRADFLYCNGMRPQIFQCERQGEVFKEGECKPADNTCDVCQPNEMKKSTDKCEEFFHCEKDAAAGPNAHYHWRQYICTNGRSFYPERRQCVSSNEYQCPTKTQCQNGESYSIECGTFFLCNQGRFVPGKCPDMTRWDGTERRCVYSAQCRQFKELDQKICQNGQLRPSADCKQYEECFEGRWVLRACKDYASDRLKDPCRFCLDQQGNRGGAVPQQQQTAQQQQKDFYPLEQLLPTNFNPFDGQGVRQRRCVEGEKIVNRHDCARFMECVDGDWFNLACPHSHFFSSRTQSCALASSANSSAMPMCEDLMMSTGSSANTAIGSQSESLHLLPIYSPNDTLVMVVPGAGPLPELKDAELRRNYQNNFDFCFAESAQRIPNPYDCTKYRECVLNQGGYYAEKQCGLGTQFDPALLKCTYNYTCTQPKCVEGIREPLYQCGNAKECRDGKWHEFKCPQEMAFVGGKCSDKVRCQSTNPTVSGQCVDGHTRAHQTDCSKYLLCRFGVFVENNCNMGHRFNPTIGRCDPHYECPAANRPPCYEGEIRAISKAGKQQKECQTDYELCRDGRFEQQSCPYGEHFVGSHCQVGGMCATANNNNNAKDGNHDGNAANGVHDGKCQESAGPRGFRADGQNCSKFYQCAQGRWVPKECAKGTVFNPVLGVCDWPANVPGC